MTESKRPLSKRIKHYTPEIIAGLTITTGVAVAVYFKTTSRLHLSVPAETLEYIREGGETIFKVKGHAYTLKHIPNT